ncbi:MAG: DUF3574 domain-containing protein [Desulfotomaculaceae bacterium]|nr:DUF3574 domain-containing protein [Desulfotomaculaceae bacterium]
MKNRFLLIFMIFLLCLTLSGCAAQPGTPTGEDVRYTLYIGLNDKNTYTQLLSTEDAANKVTDIALKYADGFTQLSGKGAYKDEKGVITHENCLIFEFYGTNEEQVKAIMDEVLQELNQNSILIEKQTVNYEFYAGAKP